MTKDEVDRWLAAYIQAWETYDHGQIAALFSEDIAYRYQPYDDPIEGRDAVVASWLGEDDDPDDSGPDEPGTWDATYAAVAVEGDIAVATGKSSYRDSPDGPIVRVYDNCYVMRFDSESRCSEFTEWYMKRPTG